MTSLDPPFSQHEVRMPREAPRAGCALPVLYGLFVAGVIGLVVYYAMTFNRTFQEGTPRPTRTHTEPLEVRGHTRFVTDAQKQELDRLQFALIFCLPMMVLGGGLVLTDRRFPGFLRRSVPSMLRRRCPRCNQGVITKTLLTIHDACPACGLRFNRPHGYMVGAMYISYPIGLVLTVPPILWLWYKNHGIYTIMTTMALLAVAVTPLVVQYARVIWLHLDFALCPDDGA